MQQRMWQKHGRSACPLITKGGGDGLRDRLAGKREDGRGMELSQCPKVMRGSSLSAEH